MQNLAPYFLNISCMGVADVGDMGDISPALFVSVSSFPRKFIAITTDQLIFEMTKAAFSNRN